MSPRPPSAICALLGAATFIASLGVAWSDPTAPEGPDDNGVWSEVTILGRNAPAAAIDSKRDRMVLFGGTRGQFLNDLWSLPLDGLAAWSRMATEGTGPGGRDGSSMDYDSGRDRMILFGGHYAYDKHPVAWICESLDDAWILSLSGPMRWTPLSPGLLRPPPRYLHGSAYDPVRDRLLVLAGGETRGSNAGCDLFRRRYNDAWALSLSEPATWNQLPAPPPELEGPGISCVYDPVADRLLAFAPPATFALDLSGSGGWSSISTTGEAPTKRGKTLYDASRSRVLLFDGQYTWSFATDTHAWSRLSPTGTAPLLTGYPAAVMDAHHGRMLIFGGLTGTCTYPNDTWALSLSPEPAWSPLTSQPGRSLSPAILDPVRDRLVTYAPYFALNEVWALTLSEPAFWTKLSPSNPGPPNRRWFSLVYDAKRDRMLVHGGFDESNQALDDTWALTFADPPTWTRLVTLGERPRRGVHMAIYDPVEDRLIVHGGYGGGETLNDTWQLSLASLTWSPLDQELENRPPPRANAGAIYDPIERRLVILCGEYVAGQTGGYLNDVWALSLAGAPQWTDLQLPAPFSKSAVSAIYDPVRDRIVVHGGDPPEYSQDTWALGLARTVRPGWTQLYGYTWSREEYPTGRLLQAVIYDPFRDRMIVFAGNNFFSSCNNPNNDVWALTWGNPSVPVPVQVGLVTAVAAVDRVSLTWQSTLRTGATVYRRTPRGAWSALAVFTPDDGGRIEFVDREVQIGASYEYRLGIQMNGREEYFGAVRVEIPVALDLAILGFLPNPAEVEITVAFALPTAAPATLEVFDVAGRRVLVRSIENPGPGRHEIHMGATPRLRPGLYLVRLEQQGSLATGRVVVR